MPKNVKPAAKVRPNIAKAWDVINHKEKWNKESIEALTLAEKRLLAGLVSKVAKKNAEAQANLLPIVLPYIVEKKGD